MRLRAAAPGPEMALSTGTHETVLHVLVVTNRFPSFSSTLWLQIWRRSLPRGTLKMSKVRITVCILLFNAYFSLRF
jgi:hypothetical protein